MTNQPSSRQKSCLKAQELVIALLETTASLASNPDATENTQVPTPLEREFLQHHVAACAACRAYQVSMTHLAESLKDLATETVAVPDGLADRIMARLDFGAASQATASQTTINSPENITATRAGAQDDVRGSRRMWTGWKTAAPVAAAALLLALGIPTLYHALQTGASGPSGTAHTSEIARTVPTALPSGVSQGNHQNKQAAQTKAPQNNTEQKGGAPVTSGAIVASMPSNTFSTSPAATATTSHASGASAAPGLIASALRPVPVSPSRAAKTASTHAAAPASSSIDGQEIAYDPVESVFGSGWADGESAAMPASGNAAMPAATTVAALPSGTASGSAATATASANAANGEAVTGNDDDDPVSNLVGF